MPAEACLDLSSEKLTFFKELPESLLEKEIVVKVRVLSTKVGGDNLRMTKVKVIQSLKGSSEIGEVFFVSSGTSSCNRDPILIRGETYYLSGTISDKGVFTGVWPSKGPSEPKSSLE